MPTLSRHTTLWGSVGAASGCILFACSFLGFALWGLHHAFAASVQQDDTRIVVGLALAAMVAVAAPLIVLRLSLILLVISLLELAIDRCFIGGNYGRAARHARRAARWAWGRDERHDFDQLARHLDEFQESSGRRKGQPPSIC